MPDITKELSSVANIIGELGTNIAEAQTLMDAAYVKRLAEVFDIAVRATQKPKAQGTKAPDGLDSSLIDVLMRIGPSRYQFTETTLKVRLDLSKSLDVTGSLGLGAAFSGVTVNAALTVGYGYDYQAAAECTTVIHAIPADEKVMTALLARAKEVDAKVLPTPARSEVNDKLIEQLSALSKALSTAKKDEAATTSTPATTGTSPTT
ncbi:MAG TPA: hypothetical protein PLX89_20725 [Verrucomicrobiota bacterium]|nr:hypothetical protein [Verrucomicrobiales bacterium]HRI15428.1 hypothetical protein [Verrucomicrobiota bacterium]